MGRRLHVLALILSFAAVPALPRLACCAGLVDLHGMAFSSCCESAAQDPGTEECCDGTAGRLGPGHERPASLAALPEAAGPVIPPTARENPLPGPRLPTPARITHLYTLHASLLI